PAPATIWPLRIADCRLPTPNVFACSRQNVGVADCIFDGAQDEETSAAFLRREDHLAHVCRGGTCNHHCARAPLVRRSHPEGAVDTYDSNCWLPGCIHLEHARTRRSSIANSFQPACGITRARLLPSWEGRAS